MGDVGRRILCDDAFILGGRIDMLEAMVIRCLKRLIAMSGSPRIVGGSYSYLAATETFRTNGVV